MKVSIHLQGSVTCRVTCTRGCVGARHMATFAPSWIALISTSQSRHRSQRSVFPQCFSLIPCVYYVECNASGVELRTLDYENPGSNPVSRVLKPWTNVFTLHYSNSLSCINEYPAIDSGGYVYEQPSRINCSIWLNASQRSRDGV